MAGRESFTRREVPTVLFNNPPLLLVAPAKYDRPLSSTKPGYQDSVNPASVKRAHQYDWARNLKAALTRANDAEIEEILPVEVGRVVEGNKITSLYNLDRHGSQHFVAFDGNDVLARVPQIWMKDTIVVELAALHIGLENLRSHPDDTELETHFQQIKGGDWAIHVYPKGGSNAKKARF
ncbi:POT family protein [Apiospora arundinis]